MPFAVQVVLWLVISGVLVGLLRPAALHRFRHRSLVDLAAPAKSPMTNLTGYVEESVGDAGHPGRVKIKGESWRAVTDADRPSPTAPRSSCADAFGTTLWVERV